MKETVLQLEIPDELSFDQLLANREKDGKFIVYEYLIPRPFFPPIKRFSKIYYLSKGEDNNKYAFKYNLLTLIWGWWGLPFGPSYTYSTLMHNKTGTDLSEDVFENLTQHDWENKRVSIKKISAVFIHPDKSTLKEITKAFNLVLEKNVVFETNPVVGFYVDAEKPYHIIGLNENDLGKQEEIRNALLKYFYAHMQFEFLSLNEPTELRDKLVTQGVELSIII